ncbi:MAG: PQQ-dependent dehydrogenase, methanol/ethanol family [Trueperaceae bacterium]|nr:PQQ-dependent dehydrogenase, methanol/ethanol family [Trueperaceae bacterium]MCO5173637.1 PQQ-dependent dehydrogenase, methanol/ethanol family [Trueperaceae bacterium]MCW5819854.1 PQQ-dependent dehydrogenase, methanol/ethanol family [Trueperaceae bacterium]
MTYTQPARRNGRRSIALGCALAVLLTVGAAFANAELIRIQRDAGQWVMANGNYQGWNYSTLNQITSYNVKNLQVKWTLQLGVTDSLEAPPIVVGNTMYILTPKPNTVYALDLTREGFIKWSYRVDQPNLSQAKACCGAQSRGISYADGKIILNSLDGQLMALDAGTGAVLWNTQVTDLSITETTTNAPLIVGSNILIGNEGGERGVRGWVAAYDLQTGEQVWKFYNTGPNADMGIGERWNPFYEIDKKWTEPGVDTWYGDSWKLGGGTAWGYFTYDPESNLFYYGTANCGPWNPDYRRDPATAPGLDQYLSKYCASTIARDATTGEMVWAYQNTPQDQWDFDEPGQNFVADLTIDGQVVKALIKPARNGFFYVFDRLTGELVRDVFAYTNVNWASGVDRETGMPIYNEDALTYTDIPTPISVCPFIAGNNWYNDAYSPATGLVYFQAENRCATFTGTEAEYTPGESYILMSFTDIGNGPGGWTGELQAWDPVTGQKAWGLKTSTGNDAKPVFATAGNLVFGGTDTGEFRAVDARSGQVLWTFRTGSNFRGSPMSYTGPDGKQYLAVVTSQAPTDPQIGTDTTADAAGRYRRAGTTLYVFGLP